MPGKWNRYAHLRIPRAAVLKLSASALIAGLATCLTAGGAFASTSAYAPPPPPVTVPGGFTAVVTTVTIGPAGGTIGPILVDGALLTITIPAGAFGTVQFTVTAPTLSAIAPVSGFHDVSGAGIEVTQGGTPFPGLFGKPVTATWRASDITAASMADVFNGSAFVTDPSSSEVAGAISVNFDSDPDFVIESPVIPVTVVPHVTVPVTGEPFLGEGILAGVLVLGGAGGVVLSRRRRTQA